MNAKNTNDLTYAIAKRVRDLADRPLDELRSIAGYGCETQSEARRVNAHMKRGELLELIVTEEFIEEFPKEIVQ